MEQLRSASEQHLASSDCLSTVASCRLDGGKNPPSVESLMTLLWAIRVISKEISQKEEPKLDVATGISQACEELDDLFGLKEVTSGRISFSDSMRQKFLGRTAHY